jgi:hypothetical protein
VRVRSIGAFIALLASTAGAQPPSSLSQFIKDLDAPEAQARIDATEQLFDSPAISLKQMEKALREEKLSPEQRQRLLGVAAHRFRSEPRAAMGIGWDSNPSTHGVTLATVQPEFPSAKVLKVGDRVIAAAGVTIDTWETMRAVIISRDPGDQIPITVVREGATLNLTVELGDFTRLKQAAMLDPGLFAEAWRVRAKGLSDPDTDKSPLIVSDLPAVAWTSQYSLLPDEAADLGLATRSPEEAVALVAGGEPRGGLQGVIQPPIPQRAQFNLRALPNRGNPNAPNVDPAQQILVQQAMAFRSLLQDRAAEQASLLEQLKDPGLTPQRRESVRLRLDGINEQIKKLSQELTRIDAQLNPRQVR